MLTRLRRQTATYPGQFWLMFWGMLMSTIGASMIWPFLMIYVSARLDRPLAEVASLMTLNSLAGLAAALLVGPISDRLGRKWVMVVSLTGNGLVYLSLERAVTWVHFAALMALWGFFSPIYRVGGDAMVADLVTEEHRADAYALMRMSTNVGVAIGPAVGGFLASTSYHIAFLFAASGLIGYSLLLTFFARETLPRQAAVQAASESPWRSYGRVLRDTRFLRFDGLFVVVQMCAVFIWIFMGVYAKTQYGLPESRFGLIAATNASLVVLFQFAVTLRTKQHPSLRVMAVGALLYALGVGSVAFARDFWGFWASMVIYTVGELLVMPTASAYVAKLAPETMRGRYMGIFGLSWNVASGIAAPLGGWLSDAFGPVNAWYGGSIIGLLAATGFWRLQAREQNGDQACDPPTVRCQRC